MRGEQFEPQKVQIFAMFTPKMQFWTIIHFWKWKILEIIPQFFVSLGKIDFLDEYSPMGVKKLKSICMSFRFFNFYVISKIWIVFA